MQDTSQIWACEYEIESGDILSPDDFPHKAIVSEHEWFGFDLETNEIYWIQKEEKRMIHMSRDFVRINHPNLFKLYKKMKYD